MKVSFASKSDISADKIYLNKLTYMTEGWRITVCEVLIATEKQSFAYNEFFISWHHCPNLPLPV
jgi:hypothetical protein